MAKEAASIMNLYEKIFEDAYLFMKQNLKPKMELLECNYIMQVRMQNNAKDKQKLDNGSNLVY